MKEKEIATETILRVLFLLSLQCFITISLASKTNEFPEIVISDKDIGVTCDIFLESMSAMRNLSQTPSNHIKFHDHLPGRGTTISIKRFSDPNPSVADDESYIYLTMFSNSSLKDSKLSLLESEGISWIGFVSSGQSPRISRQSCFGHLETTSSKIKILPDRRTAEIDIRSRYRGHVKEKICGMSNIIIGMTCNIRNSEK